MPIPVTKFDHAVRPLEERILEFLSKDEGNAFSLDEIIAAVEELDPLIATMVARFAHGGFANMSEQYHLALQRLLNSGDVREARVGGVAYYARTR